MVMEGMSKLGITAVTLTIVLVVGFLIASNVLDQIDTNAGDEFANTTAQNSTQTLITAMGTIPGWVPLIILVSIGGLLLMMIKGFGGRN